jgi:HEAT repeat protein
MKIGLNAKLGLGIVIVFGLITAVFYVYTPGWYKYYKWRLLSDDAVVRDSAAAVVASEGAAALPYVRNWLDSDSENLFAGACLVLEKMDGSAFLDELPILERALDGRRSKTTDAVAALFVKKKYGTRLTEPGSKDCKFEDKPIRLKNILLYWLFNDINPSLYHWLLERLDRIAEAKNEIHRNFEILFERDKNKNNDIVNIINFMDDYPGAGEFLARVLKNEKDEFRVFAARSCVGLCAPCLVQPLIDTFYNSSGELKYTCALALAEMGDNSLFDVLISELQNASRTEVDWYPLGLYMVSTISDLLYCNRNGSLFSDASRIINAIGEIGGEKALDAITSCLKAKEPLSVRYACVRALLKFDNAPAPLLREILLDKKEDVGVREYAALALGRLKDTAIVDKMISILQTKGVDVDSMREKLKALEETMLFGDMIVPCIEIPQDVRPLRAIIAHILGEIGDVRAIEPLKRQVKNDSKELYQSFVRQYAILSLSKFEPDNEIFDIMRNLREKSIHWPDYPLAWLTGSKVDFDFLDNYWFDNCLLAALKIKWGKAEAIEELVFSIKETAFEAEYFVNAALKMLPEECPAYHVLANHSAREREAEALIKWYKENRNRIYFNSEAGKYRLKPIEPEK